MGYDAEKPRSLQKAQQPRSDDGDWDWENWPEWDDNRAPSPRITDFRHDHVDRHDDYLIVAQPRPA
jgi:hypothetical protein